MITDGDIPVNPGLEQKGQHMAGKRAGAGSKAVSALVGAAAAYGARKVLFFAWKRVTGKEPPDHPEDPQVALSEAIIWGIVLGAGVHTAKMLATRAASGHRKGDAGQSGGSPV
jgi:Protein of unknown function (DUF4235)